MTIVNFTIRNTFEEQIQKVIEEKGFQSRAEFFRVAAMNYVHNLGRPLSTDEEFDYLTSQLARTLKRKFAGRKLPSLEEQLKDL